MIRVVVLLGPPGAGKSTIGSELSRLGLRWRDWEVAIIERWGSREEFLVTKAIALPALHRDIRAWIATDTAMAVLESTGLSDAPLLNDLLREGIAFIVRLDVPETTAVTRVSERAPGRHLSDDPEASRRVWHAFQQQAAHWPADLAIDTTVTPPTDAAATILEAVENLSRR